MTRIDEIRDRLAKATPGPWAWDGSPVAPDALIGDRNDDMEVVIFASYEGISWDRPNRVADQSFIAHEIGRAHV